MRLAIPVLALLLAGCGGGGHKPLRLDMPPLVLAPVQQSHVADGRGRFREILVAVRAGHAQRVPARAAPRGRRALHRGGVAAEAP
ncbi:MAG: hypothetical protein ACYS0K_11985 [Planctomycetota bacterium]